MLNYSECNYSEGKIYKIICDVTNNIYYGSTTLNIDKRLYLHKKRKNRVVYQKMKEPKIYLLEKYDCESKCELLRKEGEFILNHDTHSMYTMLNKNIAGRTHKEWRSTPAQRLKENIYSNQYYEKHKEEFKEKISCECGSSFRRDSRIRHFKSKKHIKHLNNTNQLS